MMGEQGIYILLTTLVLILAFVAYPVLSYFQQRPKESPESKRIRREGQKKRQEDKGAM
jgi:hypothetical protein